MSNQITNIQLLKFLPLDAGVRAEFLGAIENFDADQTLELSKTCWILFYELINAQVQYEFKKALIDITVGKGKLSPTLYREIEDHVYMRFLRDLKDQQEAELIEDIRNKLKLMTEERLKTAIPQKRQVDRKSET